MPINFIEYLVMVACMNHVCYFDQVDTQRFVQISAITSNAHPDEIVPIRIELDGKKYVIKFVPLAQGI